MIIKSQSSVGYQHPAVEIRNVSNDSLVQYYDLDLTDGGGLYEEYEDHYTETEDIKGTVDQYFKGRRIFFTLSYAGRNRLANQLKLKDIVNYLGKTSLYYAVLIPRTDAEFDDRKYRVQKDPSQNITIGVKRGGSINRGIKGFILKLKTRDLIQEIDLRDPSIIKAVAVDFTA